jgi:hypothetical protein
MTFVAQEKSAAFNAAADEYRRIWATEAITSSTGWSESPGSRFPKKA